MNQDFSFRMMQGKGGKSGHIRKEGQQVSLSFRHLPPSLPCTLYRDGHVVDTRPSSLQGTLQFTCHRDGFFFLCHERQLLLWEAGEDGDQNYFRAQKMIPRPEQAAASLPVPPSKQYDPPDHPAMQETPAAAHPAEEAETFFPSPEISETPMPAPQQQPYEQQPSQPAPPAPVNKPQTPSPESPPALFTDENLPPAQASPQEEATLSFAQRLPLAEEKTILPPAIVCEPVNLPAQEVQPQRLPPPILKPRSSAPSVMTLPPLQWPPALTHLQALFNTGTPYRPFWKPEFRCVKVPAKNPALPYSIMGYQVRNGRICALLQAVPGHPLIPPRGFEGAPYRDGHFIRIHPLPQK